MTQEARSIVLARLRQARGVEPTSPSGVERRYRTTGRLAPGSPEVLDQFAARVRDYGSDVHRVTSQTLSDRLRSILDAYGVVGIPRDLPDLAASGVIRIGARVLTDGIDLMSPADFDSVDVAVTNCAVAISETGSVVLDGSADQGRRILTLLPDAHLCIVRAEQVVQTVPEALARLEPTRPLTFISGPSATSDIELVRVQGVHGPRTLHVCLVEP